MKKRRAWVNTPHPLLVCAFPGCDKQLTPRTTSMVCSKHHHKRGYCQCLGCRRKAGLDVGPPASRTRGTKAEALPDYQPPAKTLKIGITLHRAPWEDEELSLEALGIPC